MLEWRRLCESRKGVIFIFSQFYSKYLLTDSTVIVRSHITVKRVNFERINTAATGINARTMPHVIGIRIISSNLIEIF